MLLNCDLGESYGSWAMGLDAEVMPHIDQANIACGFHGGDPLTIGNTLAMAAEHGVQVGAHPAYPDLVGFGRRSMALSAEEIISSMHYQIAALEGMARTAGLTLAYVKPHGALYNDMMAREEVRHAIMRAMAAYHSELLLMLQATPEADTHRAEAADFGLELLFEAFADRCYDDDGRLLSRRRPGAVHNRENMLAQVAQLKAQGTVTTVSGKTLELSVDTLCVHGDNPEGVQAIREIRALIQGS
ncbi:5-oxoprolinase subunit PxpA [Seongchinamella unica]|uniref:5-oxoprolinase subunit PxpA n=1 Tax=Seongchinamella unica TaxID=2547392 RepID=A0A4R5LNZ8_9GAMM|nr:5-oxoprolinase subunit PxpA [Seongchinamella unica]TDG12107.1 5-oxoprolinase subunit PxpA [Seongchinamella unica]